ncbi:MAG: GTP-binding protein [Gammaproteobacteria bacterium]|nr:GTP-binding protein [Gammaproteobacteria bacterium]
MLSRKICLIGKFYVGKTSLVRRFVHEQFDEKYQTTIGVKIDTKTVTSHGEEMKLVIWDIQGAGEAAASPSPYLNGAHGFLIVADGTRPDTVEIALELKAMMAKEHAARPLCLLINKCDLEGEWSVSDEQMGMLNDAGVPLLITSAKSGINVERAFQLLADQLLEK